MNQRELSDVIMKAAEAGARNLPLRATGLTSLPPEIGQLSNLTTLKLDGNQLHSLPYEINQLASLTNLSVAGNYLTFISAHIPMWQYNMRQLTTVTQVATLALCDLLCLFEWHG